MNILNVPTSNQPYHFILAITFGEVKLNPLFNVQAPKNKHSLSSADLR